MHHFKSGACTRAQGCQRGLFGARPSGSRPEGIRYTIFRGVCRQTKVPDTFGFTCGTGSCRNPKKAMRDTEGPGLSALPGRCRAINTRRVPPNKSPSLDRNHIQGLAATCESSPACAEPHFPRSPPSYPSRRQLGSFRFDCRTFASAALAPLYLFFSSCLSLISLVGYNSFTIFTCFFSSDCTFCLHTPLKLDPESACQHLSEHYWIYSFFFTCF